MLARAGVMPQEAQRQMRHADIKTTLRHYTDLRLSDQARAVAKLPRISEIQVALTPTGTDGPVLIVSKHPQQYSQHSVRQTGQNGAPECELMRDDPQHHLDRKTSVSSGKHGSLRGRAKGCNKAGEEDRTPDIQLGKRNAPPIITAEYKDFLKTPSSIPSSDRPGTEITQIVAQWPKLPPALRAAILALVEAASVP